MKLIVQPGDGIAPLVKAIDRAKHSVELMIFRIDRKEIETAMIRAAGRGVFVHALIASTNHGGEASLRELETRLLAAGVTVARTDDDLIRYHGKYMIIDRHDLFILAFNLTLNDMERRRSFGVMTSNSKLVQEAAKLFEADAKRQPYQNGNSGFVVSPLNSRKQLTDFIAGARRELIIYDPKISDVAMLRLLGARAKAGVHIRVLGRMTRRLPGIEAHAMADLRLHTRTIIRDGTYAFVGSQSLRTLELDARREVGVTFRDPRVCRAISRIFEEDWDAALKASSGAGAPVAKVARRVAKAVTREVPLMVPMLEGAVKELVGQNVAGIELNAAQLEHTMKSAVKQAVQDVVRDVMQEVVEVTAEEIQKEPPVVRDAGGKCPLPPIREFSR